eukprot:s761_g3.t2
MEDSQVRRNLITYNAAISAFGKAELWDTAMSLLADMTAGHIEADTITFTSAIDSCARGTRWEEALALYRAMEQKEAMKSPKGPQGQYVTQQPLQFWGVDRNDFTWNALMNACSRGSFWEGALAIFDVSSDPNPGAFAAVMSGAGDAGAWEAALALLRKMAHCRLMATGVEFGSVLRGAPPALREELLLAFHALYFGAEASWTELFGSPRHAVFGPLADHCVKPAGNKVHNSDPRRAGQVDLLAEMQGLLALSKPAGLSTDDALGIVAARRGHPLTRASRLDLPTSGVLVAAEGEEHSEQAWWLLAQFSGRLVSKEYLCLCFGDAGDIDHTFEITEPLRIVAQRGQSRAFVDEDGLTARTTCRVLAKLQAEGPESVVSLISAKPITGRTHQIRAHLASFGLALVGDRSYSSAQGSSAAWEQALAVRHWCPSLFLHCWRVELIGLGGGRWAATAELPEELAKALRGLRCQSMPSSLPPALRDLLSPEPARQKSLATQSSGFASTSIGSRV